MSLTFFTASMFALSSPSQASCELVVGLEGGPAKPDMKVHFSRTDNSSRQLLVTSLSITDASAPQRVDHLELDRLQPYMSHLTGWFVLQQGSRELWVGLTLEKGQSTGQLTVSVPGLLARTKAFPEEYELQWRLPAGTLATLAAGAEEVVFAETTSVVLEEPSWGNVVPAPGSAWESVSVNAFGLNNHWKEKPTHTITIQREPNFISVWLDARLGHAASGFGLTALVLSGLYLGDKLPSNRRQRVALLILLVALGMSVLTANSFEWQAIVFQGATFLGISVAAAVFLAAPESWMEVLSKTTQGPLAERV